MQKEEARKSPKSILGENLLSAVKGATDSSAPADGGDGGLVNLPGGGG